MADDPHVDTIYLLWLLLDWIPAEGKRRRRTWPSVPLLLDYLETIGHTDRFEKRLWREMADRPYSFYSVLEVEPGVRMKIQDVLTLREYVVLEQSASRIAGRGCIMFSKVLPAEKVSILLGAAPILIPPIERAKLIELREGLNTISGDKLTEELLAGLKDEQRRTYLVLTERQLQPPELELRNTDGDPLAFHTLRFRLHCSPQEAFQSLKSLAWNRQAEDLLAGAEFDRTGQLRAIEFPWCVEGNPVHKSWDNTILGHFSIKQERLKVEVNSEPRAERVCAEIRARLGDRAVLQQKVAKSVEELMEASRSKPETASDRRRRDQDEEFARLPKVQELVRQMTEQHWQAWLDTEIPALKGQTPREAAKTARGRELLEALLDDYALRTDERNEEAFSVRPEELRHKLGLTAP